MIKGNIVNIIDDKTIKVRVVEVKKHPLYNKTINVVKYIMCHNDGLKDLNIDDNVLIALSKPYSKMKKHIVVKKLDI